MGKHSQIPRVSGGGGGPPRGEGEGEPMPARGPRGPKGPGNPRDPRAPARDGGRKASSQAKRGPKPRGKPGGTPEEPEEPEGSRKTQPEEPREAQRGAQGREGPKRGAQRGTQGRGGAPQSADTLRRQPAATTFYQGGWDQTVSNCVKTYQTRIGCRLNGACDLDKANLIIELGTKHLVWN